jgi:endoglucanase
MINYIDDDGYIYCKPIGGWDGQVLVGQRVRIAGNTGDVIGVVGKRPIHLMSHDERTNASSIKQLWLDIGCKKRAETLSYVQVGQTGVIDSMPLELLNGRLVSRSLDNRIGAFVVLETVRRLAQQPPEATVVAVATTQEEISSAGAATATFRIEPDIALVVDVTYATDHPDSDKKQHGDVSLGNGPVLSRGGVTSPLVYQRLIDIATREAIPYSLQPDPGISGTDADAIHMARTGVATGVISIPNRYMHSPNEMIDMSDVEHAIQLMVAFIRSVQSATEFIYE